MVVDKLINEIVKKRNPCIVGIDPEWSKIPNCYKHRNNSAANIVFEWSTDIIDAVADIVPAIKPQIAFFEVYGFDGIRIYEEIIQYAHSKGLFVIDDSKRNDIGNTAKAYAFAHLSKEGPINADFMTVSPFLGTDSIKPFIEVANNEDKGIFILVKTSNPSSTEISNSFDRNGIPVYIRLANLIKSVSENSIGRYGYSGIGAVVGATFPNEARVLREIMNNNIFLVPGFGAQGADAKDIINCFNADGLGAVINSSRAVLYHYLQVPEYDDSRSMYINLVRHQASKMKINVYNELKSTYPNMLY